VVELLLNELDREGNEGDAAGVWGEVIAPYGDDHDDLGQQQVALAGQCLDMPPEQHTEEAD